MRASVLLTPGGHHAPTALSVRPLRRRVVGHPPTVALVGRIAWPSAEVATQARGKRRLLPAEERLRLADAAAQGVPYGRQTVYYHRDHPRRVLWRHLGDNDSLRCAFTQQPSGTFSAAASQSAACRAYSGLR